MAKRIEHYEYLAQDRIRNLYQQIHSGRWHDFPIEVSPSVPFIGQITVSKPSGKEPSLPQQLQAVVKHLQKHQPGDIGTVDMPKRYILGTLPVFSHFLPQEPKVNVAAIPEFIYYGGSTETTILGLAGPVANIVGRTPTTTGTMGLISSALPDLVRVLAKEYHVQTRVEPPMRGWEDSQEGEALGCVWYMETYNRQGMQMRTFSFLAALKLDSEKRAGWIMEGKRIILATPLYMALAE